MKPALYILVGIPGSGKSTWAAKQDKNNGGTLNVVSRDKSRFDLLKPNEDYFAHETEAFKNYIVNICHSLVCEENVIADATHLNKPSRRKLTYSIDRAIGADAYSIVYVCFTTPFEICMERNNKREGLRRVPKEAMIDMADSLFFPDVEEDKRALKVIYINENGEEVHE